MILKVRVLRRRAVLRNHARVGVSTRAASSWKQAAAGAVGTIAATAAAGVSGVSAQAPALEPLTARKTNYVTDPKVDPVNTYDELTTYNNFYEFGGGKRDPSRNSGRFKTKPWTVKVDGLCKKLGNYGIEDLVNFNALEERVYRHRCVEAWSYRAAVDRRVALGRAEEGPSRSQGAR